MKKINWRKEISLFFLISFMIWVVLFAFFYGLFLIAEFYLTVDLTASQVLGMKWFFSLYFSILFSVEAWAIGAFDLIALHLERKNLIRALEKLEFVEE